MVCQERWIAILVDKIKAELNDRRLGWSDLDLEIQDEIEDCLESIITNCLLDQLNLGDSKET